MSRLFLDRRKARDLYHELIELARVFLPEWKTAEDPFAQGLFKTMAEIWDEFIGDLNQLPTKTFLDFLRLTGLKPRGPQAARSIVVFELNEKATETVTIPQGAKVAAGETVFETENEILATPARISALVGVLPEKDAFFEHLEDLEKNRPFSPFSGKNLQLHTLYLGDSRFLFPDGKTDLLLELAKEVNIKHLKKALSWSYWDGEGWNPLSVKITIYFPFRLFFKSFIGLEPTGESLQGLKEKSFHPPRNTYPWLTKDFLQGLKTITDQTEQTENGSYRTFCVSVTLPPKIACSSAKALGLSKDKTPLYWLKIDVNPEAEIFPRLTQIRFITPRIFWWGTNPDFLLQGGKALPVSSKKGLSPFGNPPIPGALLYVGTKHPLSPGQKMQIVFDSFSSTTSSLSLTSSFLSAASEAPPIFWEFFDGQGWQHLDGSWDLSKDQLSFSFEVPRGIAPLEINGHHAYWLRVRYEGPLPLDPSKKSCLSCSQIKLFASEEKKEVAQQVFVENAKEISQLDEERPVFEPLSGPTAIYFGLDKPLAGGPYQIYFEIEEPDPPSPAKISWEVFSKKGWERIKAFDETDGFSHSGTWRLSVSSDHQPRKLFGRRLYWLRIKIKLDAASLEQMHWRKVYLNAVSVREGETFHELLGLKGLPAERIQLLQSPVVEISLKIQGKDWRPVENLENYGPDDCVVEVHPEGGLLIFGDGKHGKVPPSGKDILEVTYRVGGGREGNVARGAINQLISGLPLVTKVFNPVPATGGSPKEDHLSLLRRGPKRLRHRERAITRRDLEDQLEGLEEVARAKVLEQKKQPEDAQDLKEQLEGLTRSKAAQQKAQLVIYVLPNSKEDRPWPKPQTIKALKTLIGPKLPLTVFDFEITGPEYWETAVHAELVVHPEVSSLRLTQQATNILTAFLHPVSGGYEGNGWPFGRLPYRSDFFSLLHQIEGVVQIESLEVRLRPPGEQWILLEDEGLTRAGFPPYGLVCPGPVSVTIRGVYVSHSES